MKIKEITQYYIEGLNIDELVKVVKSEFNPEPYNYDPNNPIEAFYMEHSKESAKPIVNKQSTKLYHIINYIIHLISKRTILNKGEASPINASLLQQLIGNDYPRIIDTLNNEGVITKIPIYEPREYSMSYTISKRYIEMIRTKRCSNIQLIKYEEKEELLTSKPNPDNNNYVEQANENNPLYINYNKSLSQLKLILKEETQEYISKRNYLTPIQKHYYNDIQEKLIKSKFHINTIDKNNRIYSILTSIPKDIRQFLNIRFILDIKNSHPLLFSYYLINKFNINNNIIDFTNNLIQNIKNNTNGIPYDNDNLRKLLKTNKLLNKQKTKIPIDVLMYIINVSLGQFWDDLLDKEGEHTLFLRSDIKVALFAQVFYSNSRTTRYKAYAKAFKREYPNVYKTINEHKPKGNEKQLSYSMMALESEIFQKILAKLYKKRGCSVLSIHDAIVLLDTKGSQKYSAQDIEAVIKKVFQEYNLYPTISIESFTPNQWKLDLETMEQNQPIIQDTLNHMRQQAEDPTFKHQEIAQNTLKWIEKGYIEFIVKNGVVSLHPLKPLHELNYTP